MACFESLSVPACFGLPLPCSNLGYAAAAAAWAMGMASLPSYGCKHLTFCLPVSY